MKAPACSYFEDVPLDEVAETPAITVTPAHVNLYRGVAGEVTADPATVPDLLPLCLTSGLLWRVPQPPLAVLAFMGFEWQILRSLRAGDTISSRSRVVTKRPMREGGVVVEEREIVDQRGEVVQRGRLTFLTAKRPVDSAA